MGDFLGLLGMMDMLRPGSYEERVVANHTKDGLIVDTAAVEDSAQPFETAVMHPAYREGTYVIVEMYDTREAAAEGHAKWVETMTAEELPTSLRDVSTSKVKQFGEAIGAFPEYDKHERAV